MEKITRLNWFKKVFGGVSALCAWPLCAKSPKENPYLTTEEKQALARAYPTGPLKCEWLGREPYEGLHVTREIDGEERGVFTIGLKAIKSFNDSSLTMRCDSAPSYTHPISKELAELMMEQLREHPDFVPLIWPNGGWSVHSLKYDKVVMGELTPDGFAKRYEAIYGKS